MIATKFITQTEIDVTCRDFKGRPVFTAKMKGTVPSGFGPRTTLGNTLYNMAYQMKLTEGK